jgi:hypothetical protein
MTSIALLLLALLVVIAVLVVVIVVLATRRRPNRSPAFIASARVMSLRPPANGSGYFATFELADGRVLDLAVDPATAAQLAAGQSGQLNWQGTQVLSFRPELLR